MVWKGGYTCLFSSTPNFSRHPPTRPCCKPSARSQEAAFEPPSPLTASTSHMSAETAWRSHATTRLFSLDVVNVEFLLAAALGIARVAVVAVLIELEADALVALVAVRVCLVDLCVLGEFAVGF
jgi:hypothetical protein